MVTRMLAAGQENEEIRNAGILYLNEQDVKREELHYSSSPSINNKYKKQTILSHLDDHFDKHYKNLSKI